MNVLYLTGDDVRGQSFNGYMLHTALRERGHLANVAVARRGFEQPTVHVVGNRLLGRMDDDLVRLERKYSYYSLLPVSALSLYARGYYRQADIVHLQMVHMIPFFSLFNVWAMSRQHRLVWTMHDPWLTTGHCVYPLECQRWLTGCGDCPDLGLPIPLRQDRTANNWKIKRWVTQHSKITLIAASRWMVDRIQRSPVLSHLPLHYIPFGVDLGIFQPRDKAKCRAHLGIPADAKVVAFRASREPKNYKGMEYIVEMLEQWSPPGRVCLLTFESQGGMERLRGRYPFVELGWVTDPTTLAEALAAADIFLMPSTAEAFGMMAVEAMACGTPVIVFDGTALPEVVHAPRGGTAVPYQDSRALRQAVEELLASPAKYQSLVDAGLQIVRQEYTRELYVKRHIELYENLLAQPR